MTEGKYGDTVDALGAAISQLEAIQRRKPDGKNTWDVSMMGGLSAAMVSLKVVQDRLIVKNFHEKE